MLETPVEIGTDQLAMLRDALLRRSDGLAAAVRSQPPDAWVKLLDAAEPARGYRYLPPPLLQAGAQLERELGADGFADYLLLVLASLIADFDRRFASSALGDAFRPEFVRNFSRMLTTALRAGHTQRARLDNDIFLKDLGIGRMLLVPCVSHLMFRQSGVPRRAVLTSVGWGSRLRLLATVAAELGGFAPMIENHVHPAMLEHFNAEGRERCLRLVCALFEAWPDSRGLMGTSWYYDPALAAISPHLAYLHEVPAAQGAQFFDMGASAASTADATVRSAHRRSLLETGRYQPRAWMMLWAKKHIHRHYGR